MLLYKIPTHRFLLYGLLIFLVVLSFGCTPPTQINPNQEKFVIENQIVILKKSHILAVQTQLYQPSFELSGIILPTNYTNITAKENGTLTHQLVKTGQTVKKDELLAVMLPNRPFASNLPTPAPVLITAPFAGTIYQVNHQERANISQDASIFGLASDDEKFSAIVPAHLKNDFKIGQAISVNLTQADNQPTINGQIASIDPIKDNKLQIEANLVTRTHQPPKGVPATGFVVNDELKLGVMVPYGAMIGSVKALEQPPHKPTLPLTAHIWVIHQDGTLHKSLVSVIEYRPDTKRYLVAGISHDSLIVVANLPDDADGKQVQIQ